MKIKESEARCEGHKFTLEGQEGEILARAFLYVMRNELHAEPFGLMEDVFVEESLRGQGIGSELVKKLIERAKELGCYKLIATSRHTRERVHQLYRELGFIEQGLEFRIDFK